MSGAESCRSPFEVEELFDDCGLTLGVCVAVVTYLPAELHFDGLVPRPSLRAMPEEISELQVFLPLSSLVLDDVQVRDPMPRLRLQYEDVPAVVCSVASVDPATLFERRSHWRELLSRCDAGREIDDRFGDHALDCGRADVFDLGDHLGEFARNPITKP